MFHMNVAPTLMYTHVRHLIKILIKFLESLSLLALAAMRFTFHGITGKPTKFTAGHKLGPGRIGEMGNVKNKKKRTNNDDKNPWFSNE